VGYGRKLCSAISGGCAWRTATRVVFVVVIACPLGGYAAELASSTYMQRSGRIARKRRSPPSIRTTSRNVLDPYNVSTHKNASHIVSIVSAPKTLVGLPPSASSCHDGHVHLLLLGGKT
jgi:hypothetical protein